MHKFCSAIYMKAFLQKQNLFLQWVYGFNVFFVFFVKVINKVNNVLTSFVAVLLICFEE